MLFDEHRSWTDTASTEVNDSSVRVDLDLESVPLDRDDVARPADEVQHSPQNSRPNRTRNLSTRLRDFQVFFYSEIGSDGELVHMALLADANPVSFEEAISDEIWRKAMKEELASIEKNKTWDLVDLPANKTRISVKWVYKVKLNPDGSISKHKARLVVRGFMQRAGLDYSEVFAPVARLETVRLIIALASWKNWELWQLDLKSAFLNGSLEEEVYITQPPGFEIKGSENKVLKLRKALYGLKQAPRAWNKRIDAFYHR